jgi:hypothetical protein
MSKPVTPLVDQTDLGAAPSAAEVAASKARTTFGDNSAPVQTPWGAEQKLKCDLATGIVVEGGRIIPASCPTVINPLSNLPTGPGSMS